MTCKEKYEEMFGQSLESVNLYCPEDFRIMDEPHKDWCSHKLCEQCWNREIPEDIPLSKELKTMGIDTPEKYREVLDVMKTYVPSATTCPTIKDSGDRTQFESGAVRDMREGKGRCDLAPLEVVADILASPIIADISNFQNTNHTKFLYSALERFAIDCYGDKNNENETCKAVCATMILEVAKHFEEGAKKYGESNWRKGIPVYCYIDSAIRHYLKWLRGDKDEFHCRAFCWNVMCCIWEVDYHDKTEKE